MGGARNVGDSQVTSTSKIQAGYTGDARNVSSSQVAGKSRNKRVARGNRNTRYAGVLRDTGNSRSARYSESKNRPSGTNYLNYANNDRKRTNNRANRHSDYRGVANVHMNSRDGARNKNQGFQQKNAKARGDIANRKNMRDRDDLTRGQKPAGGQNTMREQKTAKKQSSPLSKISERIEKAKHDVKKSRAGKMFERQFEDAPSTASTNAPRAALYKAEMGKTQRYSQKLQREGNAGVRRGSGISTKGQASGRANSRVDGTTNSTGRAHANAHITNSASFWDKTPHVANMRKKHPILTASVAVFLVLVMGVGYMFPTAQTYYKTMRENDRTQAEYEAVLARNDDLQKSIDSLSTADGIENLAHAEYNLTKQGETSVSVQGIEDNSNILDKVNASIKSENVAFPTTWYSGVLDQIFGVK